MPMYDWTRVSPNDFHDFHVSWLVTIRTALNSGLLPRSFFALAEHVTPPYVPDVIALEESDREEQSVIPSQETGTILTLPKIQFASKARDRGKVRPPQRWVAIRQERTRRLVAVIELVSPGNKADRKSFDEFLAKSLGLLRANVNLLLVDPFPPSRRDPDGIHGKIWKSLTRKSFALPENQMRTLASYSVSDGEYSSYVNPIAVGDVLPDMPLFLKPSLFVNVPLEATYEAAWTGYPKPLRDIVSA